LNYKLHIPLIALDEYSNITGISSRGILSPFACSWQSMEYVAMFTMRYRWNAFYFTDQNCEVSVDQLRPGALHKYKNWLENTKAEGLRRDPACGIICVEIHWKSLHGGMI